MTYTNEQKKYPYIFFCLLLILIAIPAFFRGMFFEMEQVKMYSLAFPLFAFGFFTIANDRKKVAITTPLDMSIILLTIGYIISLFVAISYKLAILDVLKYVNYIGIYFMIRHFAKERINVRIILNTIFGAITVISLIGVLNAVGAMHLNGAYSVAESWINSTLQYHNAFASLVLCGIILGFALYIYSENAILKGIYVICGYILMLGFIFSYSRGAWLFLPVAIIVFAILLWKKFNYVFSYIMQIALPVALVGNKFWNAVLLRDQSLAEGQMTFSAPALNWVLLGLLCAILLYFAFFGLNILFKKFRLNKNLFAVGFISLALIATIAIGFISPGMVAKIIPDTLADRVSDISLNSNTAKERFVFYYDAMDLIKDYPVLGAGGGAWKVIYQQYQSYAYNSNQAHSFVMQLWVETGTVGFIFFLFMIVSLIIATISAIMKKRSSKHYPLFVGVIIGVFSLLGHSLIDFDFSLISIPIIFWSLVAILATVTENTNLQSRIKFNVNRNIPTFIMIIFAVVSVSFTISNNYVLSAVKATKAENNQLAAEKFDMAKKFDPLNATVKIDSARYNLIAASDNETLTKQDIQRAIREVEAAKSIDKHNPDVISRIISFYYTISDVPKALEYYNDLIDARPLSDKTYEDYATKLATYVNQLAEEKNQQQLDIYMDKILEIPAIAKEKSIGKDKPVELTQTTLQIIQSTSEIKNLQ